MEEMQNSNQTHQPRPMNAPVEQTEPILYQQPGNQNKLITMLIIIVFVILAGAGGYYLGFNNASDNRSEMEPYPTEATTTQESDTTKPMAKESEVISYTPETNLYKNYEYKFQIEFPKEEVLENPCAEAMSWDKDVPLVTFEDLQNNIVYISDQKTITSKMIDYPDGTFDTDSSSCEEKENSLDLLKNGFNNGHSIERPHNTSFAFTKVTNDTDLNTLARKMYGENCQVSEKTLEEGSDSVYSIMVADESGRNEPGSKCWTNYAFTFLYSSKTQTAVAKSGAQEVEFYVRNFDETKSDAANGVSIITFME